MEYAIIFLPLVGAIVSGFFGKIIGDRYSEIFTSLLVSISSILSFIIFYDVVAQGYSNNIKIFSWLTSGDLQVNWSIKIDALSSTMLVIVGIVSSLVHIYSIGYMIHDDCKTISGQKDFSEKYAKIRNDILEPHRHKLTRGGLGKNLLIILKILNRLKYHSIYQMTHKEKKEFYKSVLRKMK